MAENCQDSNYADRISDAALVKDLLSLCNLHIQDPFNLDNTWNQTESKEDDDNELDELDESDELDDLFDNVTHLSTEEPSNTTEVQDEESNDENEGSSVSEEGESFIERLFHWVMSWG